MGIVLALGLAICLASPRGRGQKTFWLGWASLLGSLALMLAHGRRPFLRVWTFILPVLLGLASTGFALVLERLAASWNSARKDWAAALLCLGLMAACLTAWMPQAASLEYLVDGAYPDAPALASHIKERLRPHDLVLASMETRYSLLYYLRRLGVPDRQMPTQAKDCSWQRIWLVGSREQTLDQLRKLVDCPAAEQGAAQLALSAPGARLWLFSQEPSP